MLIIRKYKRSGSGSVYWGFKIYYLCPFSNRAKVRKCSGFHSKIEAEIAAKEMLIYIKEKRSFK